MRVEQKRVVYTYKIVIVGAGGVGKTCLFNRYCFNSFNINTMMTIGINFHSTYLKLHYDLSEDENDYYVVNAIFDFGGQERFKPLIPQFLEGASGALLVFDSVRYPSLEQLDYWYEQLIEKAPSDIPKLLIGSKADLLDKTPKGEIVKKEVILEFMERNGIDGFYRTSALENYNVLEVFKELTNLILKKNQVEACVE